MSLGAGFKLKNYRETFIETLRVPINSVDSPSTVVMWVAFTTPLRMGIYVRDNTLVRQFLFSV